MNRKVDSEFELTHCPKERSPVSAIKVKIHYISFPLASQQQLHNVNDKSVTSWRGQKSVVSVVSCRFPNSITTTCCQLVTDLLAVSLTSLTRGSYGETCVMDLGNKSVRLAKAWANTERLWPVEIEFRCMHSLYRGVNRLMGISDLSINVKIA